ncbi:hypothetical protein ACFYYN_13170 [Streptomyces sp. NPDC001902]
MGVRPGARLLELVGCGWGTSQWPQTSGAAARHRLHAIAVRTYGALIAAGAPQPLPDEVAHDDVDEFLSTRCATTRAWPHEPAAGEHPDAADASLGGTAGELVLAPYGRVPVDSLEVGGDRRRRSTWARSRADAFGGRRTTGGPRRRLRRGP